MDRKLDRDWEKDNIVYPDPAIEIISDEFKKYVIGNGYIKNIPQEAGGQKDQLGLEMEDIYYLAIFPTIEL